MVNQHSNYVMLAYGITGSGKTFTLEGEGGNIGVLPRAIEHLFEKLQSSQERESLAVCVSYYEVNNEHIIDLLMPVSKGTFAKGTIVSADCSTVTSVAARLWVSLSKSDNSHRALV